MEKNKPKLLILTGPQGSGNHLFSKLLSLHEDVVGWPIALDGWQGHHKEPFASAWEDPTLLKDYTWNINKSYVTSISCPYFKNKKPQTPKYKEFITEAQKHCDVKVAIIGREQTILDYQQSRIRKRHTTPQALEQFENLYSLCFTHYISFELFFLYGQNYLKSLQTLLNFPIAWNHGIINDYQKMDSNKKYILKVEKGDFDAEVKKAVDES